jgi:predicted MPP superfamily phosphohydrolase
LADVHLNTARQLQLGLEAAQLALDQSADVILMPGDFLNYSDPSRIGNLGHFLSAFRGAKCPVYATLGNHDYATDHPHLLIREFAGTPVRLLRNEIVDLGGVSIAGLDDGLAELYRPDILAPGEHSTSLLTMLHEPDFVDEVPSHVSLQISGHSHGGQICLPFGVAVHTPVGAWRYVDGYYADAKVPLFVTRGVGTSGPPFRLFCRPQVALLTLRPA